MKFKGQVAIVVGSGQGIGLEIARTFSDEGASLVLVDMAPMKPRLDELCQEISRRGKKAIAVVADATCEDEVNQVAEEALRAYGRIDILVNGAGFRGPSVPVQDIGEKDWDDVMAVNLKAPFLCSKAVLKWMMKQKSGNIVNIAGINGKEGTPLRGALCASKWGLLGLTKTIAAEGGPFGIRANVICPGGVSDERMKRNLEQRAEALGVTVEDASRTLLETTPLRKWASVEEVVKAAVFLASDDSSHTTGEAMNVSGGLIMY